MIEMKENDFFYPFPSFFSCKPNTILSLFFPISFSLYFLFPHPLFTKHSVYSMMEKERNLSIENSFGTVDLMGLWTNCGSMGWRCMDFFFLGMCGKNDVLKLEMKYDEQKEYINIVVTLRVQILNSHN
jgi:hypothetical protein